MAMKKLSAEEISQVISKIREKYDFYCKHFFKASKIRQAFEQRYISTLKSGMDVSNFLLAEISVIEELIEKEETKIAAKNQNKIEKKVSIADKVMEEHKKRIEKYPEINIHRDGNPEIKKLLGALNQFHDNQYLNIHSIMRPYAMSSQVRELNNLENRLRSLAYMTPDNLPTRLSHYKAELTRFPRNYQAIQREEKDYIVESAFFLHDLNNLLLQLLEEGSIIKEKEKSEIAPIQIKVQEIISDFRLKDLKKR
ncbi:MAG: hypothetical protein JXR70_15535 [Spirochaetales bacterium]|nr:hypothetical protein [Spirochaetales bacterium]